MKGRNFSAGECPASHPRPSPLWSLFQRRSKYVNILPGSMASPPIEEFSQLLDPVKFGPSQLRTLWKAIDGLFAVPESWKQKELDAWIQGQRATTPQREKVKSHDIESFIGNQNLRGLLDNVVICFDQTLERVDSGVTRDRFLQVTISQTGLPEVSLIGDPTWHSSAVKTITTFFQNERSRARLKRVSVSIAAAALGMGFGGALALEFGWIFGVLFGPMIALAGVALTQPAMSYLIPNSRVYVDERSGRPGVFYEWGAGIAIGVISGVIVLVLAWAAHYL